MIHEEYGFELTIKYKCSYIGLELDSLPQIQSHIDTNVIDSW